MSSGPPSSSAIPLPVRVSLQTKVLVPGLVCVLVPVLILGAYLLERNQRILRDKVQESLSNELLRRSTELGEWAGDRQREVARWSASFIVFEGVEALSQPKTDQARVRRDLTEFLSSIQGHNARVYESLLIVDSRGAVLAATRAEELESEGKKLVSAASERPGTLSPLFRSARLGRPTMLVLQSIQNRDARIIGYLVGRIALEDLEAKLVSPSEAAPTFWLLDERGGVLASGGKVLPALGAERFVVPLSGRDAALPGVVGETAIGASGPTLYAFVPLSGAFHGALAVTLPVRVAYRSLDESRRRILAWGVPFVLFIVLLTSFSTRRMLRPILRLSEGARRMGHGDLDVSLPVQGHDEIAQLTRVFNEMARRVREARDELALTNEGLQEANLKLATLATTDGLTGLFNHRHFQDVLSRELRLAERDRRCVSLLLLDLDHFKAFNDRFGHTEGDAALKLVADTLRA
ncbi:MAG TPA: diguanylate cyclase, partial [Thermoanaerobaculia bacterium]|nr:diguanylate cyclase [Thermoanaerobaculia bacterium]